MRYRLATLAAVLVAGCAAATPVTRPEPVVEWAPPPPLTARLYEAGRDGFVFDVSDAAFVAIFEIVPNAGASIVYPGRPGQYNYVSGGGMRVAPSIVSPVGRWMYVSGFRSYWEPTYYYLVASRRPLALGSLLSRVGGVRQVLGWRQFVTGSPYVTMNRLAEAVLPEAGLPEDDWTDDLLVVFPPAPVSYASLASWPSSSLAV
ncbi:MAG TPA: hypothetical protein VNA89_04095, partial [Gemmatimonadaceae bacterium]|nr:hypothetical protein [Gemmatimonadaceae bacterium]